jgi:hypothetical protein
LPGATRRPLPLRGPPACPRTSSAGSAGALRSPLAPGSAALLRSSLAPALRACVATLLACRCARRGAVLPRGSTSSAALLGPQARPLVSSSARPSRRSATLRGSAYRLRSPGLVLHASLSLPCGAPPPPPASCAPVGRNLTGSALPSLPMLCGHADVTPHSTLRAHPSDH